MDLNLSKVYDEILREDLLLPRFTPSEVYTLNVLLYQRLCWKTYLESNVDLRLRIANSEVKLLTAHFKCILTRTRLDTFLLLRPRVECYLPKMKKSSLEIGQELGTLQEFVTMNHLH